MKERRYLLKTGVSVMNLDDLKCINEKSIRSAGPRYTPGQDADAPNLEIESLNLALEGLICSPAFRARIHGLANGVEEAFAKVGKNLHDRFPRQFRKPKGLLAGLATFASTPPGEGRSLVRKLKRSVERIESTTGKISTTLYEAEQDRREALRNKNNQKSASSYDLDPTLRQIQEKQDLLRRYLSAIYDVREFLLSPGCELQYNNHALLLGEWGTGKTHFLCDFARHFLKQGVAALLVLAKDFDPDPDVGTALARHTGLCADLVSLVEKLNRMGKERGQRSILIIDGINENDHRIWQRDIGILRKEINSMSHVGLVLSCRQPFEHLVLSDGERRHFVKLSHHGFTDIEFDAQSEFFRFYKIPLPEVPLLAEEFSRPLTLKIMCEAFKELPGKDQRRGFSGITSGQRGMTFILEKFIKSRAQSIEADLNLPEGFCWDLIKGDGRIADSAFAGLASYMADNMQEFVPKETCLEIIRAKTKTHQKSVAKKIYLRLITEGVVVEDIVWRSDKEGGSVNVVRLPYQRFGDHLIARHLLGKHLDTSNERSIRRSFFRNARLGRLFLSESPHNRQYDMEGWVEALIVEFPERVKNVLPSDKRELFFYLPEKRRHLGAYFSPFVGGLFWRNPSAICSQTDNIIGHVLCHYNEYEQTRLLEAILAVATKPDHPYHGARLFRYFENLNIVDRDMLWSEFVRKRSSDSTVERLVHWFETHIPEELSEKSSLNLINILSLLLTSTDRLLRDRVTKVLVQLGERLPKALFDHTVHCLSFSDPYVPERMLAACYGVAMSLWADKKAKAFHKNLPGFARTLAREIFTPGGTRLTHHALIRDYALGIIELARRTHRGCIAAKNVKYIKPPFPGIPDPFPKAKRIREEDCKNAEHAIYMDFGNYTIGRLMSGRSNYDMDHTSYKEVRKRIEWRIWDLGYRWDKFKLVDQSIERGSLWRERSEQGKIDRYGKKYSWIAFFEMHGLLQSQGKLPDYLQQERVSDCDIDPSFPINPPDWQPELTDLFTRSSNDELEWIQQGQVPDYDHLLEIKEFDSNEGPWVLLDGYIQENDKDTKRKIYSFLKGLFIEDSDIVELEKRLANADHPGSGLPDSGQDVYTFSGEVPWSAYFAHTVRTKTGRLRKNCDDAFSDTLFFPKRHRLKKAWKYLYEKLGKVQRFNPVVVLTSTRDNSGSEVDSAELAAAIEDVNKKVAEGDKLTAGDFSHQTPTADEIGKGYQIVNDWKRIPGIPVELTSWYYGWESYHSRLNNIAGFRFPSPQICEKVGLLGSHRSIELLDQHGRQATIYRESRKNDETRFQLLYLRKDLVDRYLKASGRSLVWIIWGERQFHYDMFESVRQNPEISTAMQAHEHIHKRLLRY